MLTMFDQNTINNLGYYVYLLIDKTTNKPFYVGKGKGNRIFDHVAFAMKNPHVSTEKCDLIRKLYPNKLDYRIVRHKLTESEAFMLEASLIDVLKFCGLNLTNQMNGHHTDMFGMMTIDEIKNLYSAQQLTSMSNDCIIININKTYHSGVSIYDATRSCWRIDKNKLCKIKYVLAEYRGLIVEAFEVNKLLPVTCVYGPECKNAGKTYTRYEFDGVPAPSSIRNLYVGKSVAHIKVQGRANPIIYKI